MRSNWLALGFVFSQSCGANFEPPTAPPVPSPVVSPSPSPAVAAPTLLKVVGNQFHTHGRRVWLLGYGGVCCGDNVTDGWSWISEPYLRELAAHGGNFVHIRLGPYSDTIETRPNRRGYLDSGEFNPQYFADLNTLIDLGHSLGVYFEIDLIDGWNVKDSMRSPWPHGSNDCSILQRAPGKIHGKWLRKVVEEVGYHENILWQISNESGRCPPLGTTPEWELGVAAIVRDQELLSDFPRHPIATNGELLKVDRNANIDYVELHQSEAPENAYNKPIMVNEYNPFIGTDQFQVQLMLAEARGTYFQLWLSDATESERHAALGIIMNYRRAHP